MTVEIGALKARFTADSQELKAEIKNVKKDLTDLGEQGKKASKDIEPLNAVLKQIGLNTDQLKKIEDQLKKIDSTKVEQGLKDVVAELKKMGAESKQISAVEKSLIEVTQAAQQADIRIASLEAELRKAGEAGQEGIAAVGSDLVKMGDKGDQATVSVKGLGVAISNVAASKDQIATLTATLDNINARIELQRKRLADLKESYANTFNEGAKSKLQDQILRTDAALIKLTQTSDTTAKKLWTLEDSANQAATGMDVLDNALKDIGLNAEHIKVIKKHLDGVDPTKLDRQLDELSAALKKLGVDSQQIEKITNELRGVEVEATKTKQGINGLASGLAALGAGAATAKLANTIKSLAEETHQLSTAYGGLIEVSKAFNVDAEDSVGLAEELADKWGLNKGMISDTVKTYVSMGLSLEETKKIITATADAAVYNREAHLSWDGAIKQVAQGIKAGNSNLTDAAGITTNLSDMQNRYAKSIGTTAAKLTGAQKVQAAYNGLMQEASIFAGNADEAMNGYTGTQATFNQTIEMARLELGEAFLPVLQEIMGTISPLIRDFALWASENKEVVAGLAAAAITVGGLITVLTTLITVVGVLRMAFVSLNLAMGPIGWAIAGVSAVAVGVTAYSAAASAASKEVLQLAASQEELNKKLNESPASRNTSDLQKMQEDVKSLTGILEEHAVVQEKVNNLYDGTRANGSSGSEMYSLQRDLGEVNKQLKDMDFKNVEEAKEALSRMNEEIKKSAPALLEMEKAELQDVAAKNSKIISMERTVERYKELNNVQKLDETQKQELVQITNTLKAQYPDLHAMMDEEGRIRIDNIDTISQQIGVERSLITASVESAKAQITNIKAVAETQRKSVEAQIKNYQALFDVAGKAAGSLFEVGLSKDKNVSPLKKVGSLVGGMIVGGVQGAAQEEMNKRYEEQNKYAAASLEADRDLAKLTSGDLDSFAYKPPNYDGDPEEKKKKAKKEKTGKTAAELAAEKRKEAYELSMATARYTADYHDQTAEQQIEAYEKIKVKHKQFLAESLEDERSMNLLLKRLQEDTVKSRYDISASWVDAEDRRMEKSGKSEIQIAQMKVDAWTRVRDRYDKDSEYYKQADDKLFQSRKTLIQALEKAMKEHYASVSDFLKQEERSMEESGSSETEIAQMKLELWTRIRDSYAKDSEYYKQADEQVYQARKVLVAKTQKDAEEARKVEKKGIDDAKRTELAAIAERRKAYVDGIDERIAAIDRLIKIEDRLNTEQDYESLLAEKKADQKKYSDAVSPEGRQQYADITKEIERMELEHSRDIRKQNLEDQKDALQDEKSERERAFDKEKSDAEAHYDALTDVLDNHQDDVNLIETAIKDFRIDASQTANSQILSDLDSFVSAYNSKLASLTAAAGPSQQESDLQEYNNNKDAWTVAKASNNKSEMARLNERNEEIRKQYGITSDSGEKLQSFHEGGVIQGVRGMETLINTVAGEAVITEQQQSAMFQMLNGERQAHPSGTTQAPVQEVHNHFDMSIETVEVTDATDAEILYTERERTARRLATGGVK